MKEFIKDYGIVMLSSTELVVTVVLFILLGQWMDRHYQWGQTATICLSVLGAILGFTRFIIRLNKINKEPPNKSGKFNG